MLDLGQCNFYDVGCFKVEKEYKNGDARSLFGTHARV